MTATTAKIKAQVNNPKFDLWKVTGREGGYWVMQYDDEPNNIFETKSVMVMYMKSMSLAEWVSIAKEFVSKVEGE